METRLSKGNILKFLKLTILCLTSSTIFLCANDFTNAEIAYSQKKYAEAAQYYKKSCEKKHAISCCKLADLYDIGLGVEMDEDKALFYFKKACEFGYEDGCMRVEERDETKQVGC